MKPKEILSNTPLTDDEGHGVFSYETPLRPDAFEKDDDLKIELIEKHFREIMHVFVIFVYVCTKFSAVAHGYDIRYIRTEFITIEWLRG